MPGGRDFPRNFKQMKQQVKASSMKERPIIKSVSRISDESWVRQN